MVYDFDVKAFCQNLRATKPPYECPIQKCGRVYKSYSGIQFHMYNFDHDSPDSPVQTPRSGSKPNKKKASNSKWHPRREQRSPSPPDFFRSHTRETLSYADSQRIVEISLEGRTHRIDIYEPLEIISQDEIDNQDNTEKEEKGEKSPQKPAKISDHGKTRKENGSTVPNHTSKLPEAQVKVLDTFIKPKSAAEQPSSYYRYIEKSVEELDEEVEYDMDEEDHAWLELMNERRNGDGTNTISQEVFETLMDRFEKEAHFQSQTNGKDHGTSIDEDAVCSICMDGECQNSNVILFCDMCNLAVHQECYGVPYIPEGQWLCRRCLQSPSRAVDCVLCPNKGGAFKQTDDGRWAHVVCALWVPEVGFANTVFLEPVDSLQRIPPARKKLTCYICKQRGSGACIQCHKTNCYTAFHVTCAQQAGLFMKIQAIREGPNGGVSGVTKTAFCDVHMSPNSEWTPMLADDDSPNNSISAKEAKAKSRMKMRKARKILAEKRNAVPVVSIPIIPQERLSKISSLVSLTRKDQFLKRLLSYWTLKRQSRFGVPLLRRLQSNHMNRNREHLKNDKQSNALREQLKYWQRLRQDLEKARLLVELIRKREKIKRENLRLHQLCLEHQLQPFALLLRQTLDQLQEKDADGIFADPVSLEEVPDYLEYVDKPMDFSTMRSKVDGHEYRSLEEFSSDFDLIVSNCMKYNDNHTMFYKAAVKLRDQGGAIIHAARKLAERVGFDMETGLHLQQAPAPQEPENLEDFSSFMQQVRQSMPLEEQLQTLLDKMDTANSQLSGGRRARFAKNIRKQIMMVRRKLSMQKRKIEAADAKTQDTDSDPLTEAQSTTTSKLQSLTPAPGSPPQTTPHRPPGRGGWRARGRGRGRGRWGGYRRRSTTTVDEPSAKPPPDGEQVNVADKQEVSPDQPSDLKTDTTPSPVGVNRRTAVLFNNKKVARNTLPSIPSKSPPSASSDPPHSPQAPPRKVGRPPKNKTQQQLHIDTSEPKSPTSEPKATETKNSRGPVSPVGPFSACRKRSASLGHPSEADSRPSAPKRAMSLVESNHVPKDEKPSSPDPAQEDSFKNYRSRNIRSSSESDTTSDLSSGDESETSITTSSNQSPTEACTVAVPEEGSYVMLDMAPCSSPSLGSPASASTLSPGGSAGHTRRSPSVDYDELITLEPLDLVWAKCRGYPWYPALIINPKMPKTGYLHNGVPIPVPPDEVLDVQRCPDESLYLVLFFDTKRTWQWLPRQKLQPLGVSSDVDKGRLMENKKANVRKAVQKAYEQAIIHRCKVNGEPNPLSGDSSSES
ncbi:peregrin-like isoform X2 [Babylonia areolata]|uniref:peregrin-like isoform X2 n=1 Tax=Babylonia areolata TaxID=304850 RepID=UPI003FD16C3C